MIAIRATWLAALSALALTGAAQAKTLVYCSEGSPEGFNPQLFTSGTTFDATSRAIYNRLFQTEHGTTNMRPALAESFDVSDDGSEYVLKLRRNVKWQTSQGFKPSRPFNADDVVFTFQRMRDPNHPYNKVSGGNYEYFEGSGLSGLLVDVEKLNDYEVKFKLKNADATFIPVLSMDFASVLSAEYAAQLTKAGTPEKIDLNPVGTGPFELVAYQKDAVIRYRAFADYWEGKAALDNLVFAITPDASVRWQKLRAGECHVMPYPNPADLPAIKAEANVNLLDQPGLNVGYLGFNVEKKPLDDKRVRQALNYAINKDAIIQAVYQGAGIAAKNPMPPTLWGYNDEVKDYTYDPEKAKALLKEAGVSNVKIDLWAMPVQRPYNPNARRMAELVQADWKAVGVEAPIVSFEWGEYLKRTQQGEHQTFMLGWTADIADPDNFLAVLLSCEAVGATNRARFCNRPYNDLISKAKTLSKQDERVPLYAQAQLVFKDEAPWVTIAHSVVYMPVRKEVTGYKIDPFGGHIFYGVDIKG